MSLLNQGSIRCQSFEKAINPVTFEQSVMSVLNLKANNDYNKIIKLAKLAEKALKTGKSSEEVIQKMRNVLRISRTEIDYQSLVIEFENQLNSGENEQDVKKCKPEVVDILRSVLTY